MIDGLKSIFADVPTAEPTLYRTYSRVKADGKKESWGEIQYRVIEGLQELGKLTKEETDRIKEYMETMKVFPSGRWLWVGGTDWIKKPENYYGAYNCTSTNVIDWNSFGYMMDLAMQGCGTGAVLEPKYINKLPPIQRKLNLQTFEKPGDIPIRDRITDTVIQKYFYKNEFQHINIFVGDSRQGWVKAYQSLMEIASDTRDPHYFDKSVRVNVFLGNVRPSGEKLQGFGGYANPIKLKNMFVRVADILNDAVGRNLTSLECCLVIDEAALCVVAGNIRRSAGIKQGLWSDDNFTDAKMGLWSQDEHGNWVIDPKKDALRMSNHTRTYHHKPSLEDCITAVSKQYYSGEGAIQWTGEAVARSNADILPDEATKKKFIVEYVRGTGKEYIKDIFPNMPDYEIIHRLSRYNLNPCAEILGCDFFCNLSEIHLNQFDPRDVGKQIEAFEVGGVLVGSLLHHEFNIERYRVSRELDPIVGVSITGLFDFFVKFFGVEWLKWWELGRPHDVEFKNFWEMEREYMYIWRKAVKNSLGDYCARHGLKMPNRYTTLQPAGTKSLLTNASPGWHPPKASRYIRRITFRKNDPVALAAIDYGYSVIPSQSDKDDDGKLLNDPFDPRCSEWLVEIPVATSWADLPGVDDIDINKFSALAQFDFYMQVQKHYVTHNTSATIELREHEINDLGKRIYEAIQNDEGYVSSALLARYDSLESFPRMPFEPISKEKYLELSGEVQKRRKAHDFLSALNHHLTDNMAIDHSPAPCDSDKCLR